MTRHDLSEIALDALITEKMIRLKEKTAYLDRLTDLIDAITDETKEVENILFKEMPVHAPLQ